jgi:hypothetical protein
MTETMAVYESGVKELIESQKAEIKKFLAPNLTEGEFWTFIQTAKALDLNPLKREIYPIKYQDRLQIITGYEVYIKRANLSKLLEWWKVEIKKPSADFKTWIGVFTAKRLDWTQEFEWQVPMIECYKSSEKATPWTTMKEFMLKKTTIGQGLRLLIPEVLAGMPYIAEEMGSQIVDSDYTEIPEEQKIEPDPTEQEAKDKLKNEFLASLMNELEAIKTIPELEKKYKANKAQYETFDMKESILKMYASRKRQLMLELLSTQTGISAFQVDAYIQQAGDIVTLLTEATSGNVEAITQLKTDIVTFLDAKETEKQVETEEQELADMEDARASE